MGCRIADIGDDNAHVSQKGALGRCTSCRSTGGRFNIKCRLLLPTLIPQMFLGIAMIFLAAYYYMQHNCNLAGAYMMGSGAGWTLASILEIVTYCWLNKRDASDPHLRSCGGQFLTITLALVGYLLQIAAAAGTFDCAALMVAIFLQAGAAIDGQYCEAKLEVIWWMALPFVFTIAAIIIVVFVFVAWIRREFLTTCGCSCCDCERCNCEDDRGGLFLCCGSHTLLGHTADPSQEKALARLQRRCALWLMLWCALVCGAAFGLWYKASGGHIIPPHQLPVEPCLPQPAMHCESVQVPSPWAANRSESNRDREDRPYKLLLWHEGYPLSQSGSDISLFQKYVGEMVAFADLWKIERVYLQVYNPKSTVTPAYTAFSAQNVASAFVAPLNQKGIEAGLVGYLNPKDTNWDRSDPLTDFAAYVKEINDAVSEMGVTSDADISTGIVALAFDGEDLGSIAPDFSDRIGKLRQQGKLDSSIKFGYAHGISQFSMADSKEPNVDEYFPELYWYGELCPHHAAEGFYDCNKDCVDQMPCFSKPCVHNVYRAHRNNPKDMLSVVSNAIAAKALASSVAASGRSDKREIWGMFSLEHLAGCCPERVYGPQPICGTFDGFALWDKSSFLDFLSAFATHYGFTAANPMPIALYEWQFVPPHWMDPNHQSSDKVVATSTSTATPAKCFLPH